ncbi:MAG: YggS family pyridoxal phosphate-dependent enzyme [Dehalococcoidales bacterium]|nr:YggS family pyridoxal phosphate-dependent enzyme [Dehalococcoidales bacterium]
MSTIEQNVKRVLSQLPGGVQLVAAAKSRTPETVLEAVNAGIKIIGENYVQEAERAFSVVGGRVKWHFIGHLQHNKVKKAVGIFDVIETVDSVEIAREIDRRCSQIGRTMQVLIEVNSGREKQKTGVFPDNVEALVKGIAVLSDVQVVGLMTIGPLLNNPEEARPYFAATRELFEEIKGLNLANVEMKYLSMGMTNSYQVAIEEGSNIVRLGRKIFEDC